jgi:hypothetical protein
VRLGEAKIFYDSGRTAPDLAHNSRHQASLGSSPVDRFDSLIHDIYAFPGCQHVVDKVRASLLSIREQIEPDLLLLA